MSLNSMRKAGFAAAVLFSLTAAGCGVDDVQLNGKIFDAVGLNSTGSVSKGDPKIAARRPLVLPPSGEALPPPGSGQSDQTLLAAIQDPDRKETLSHAELQRQQDEYCKKNYTDALQRGDETAHLAKGPLGRCEGSIFNAVKKWTSKTDDEESDASTQ